MVRLDLADCFVDALEVARAVPDIGSIPVERLPALAALFEGEFLDGLEIDRSPVFDGWLVAQRRRFRSAHAALLERLALHAPDHEALDWLERWLELAPFDRRVHELMLGTLARRGLVREGEEHLAAAARLFEAEGLDCAPLGDFWRRTRAQSEGASPAQVRSTAAADEPGRADRPGCPARLDRGHAVRRQHRAVRRAGRPCRRARARRDHQARQAAQPVRDRPGHGVRPARARDRTEGGRPHAERRLCGRAASCDSRASASRCRSSWPRRGRRGSSGRRSSTTSSTTPSSSSTRSATGSSPRSRARSRRSSATAPS